MTSNGNEEVKESPSPQKPQQNGTNLKRAGSMIQGISPIKKSHRNGSMGLKRHHSLDSFPGTPRKKMKTNGVANGQQPKNTVAMLNELRQGLVYNLEGQTGPVHAPVFTMTVEVDGEKFIGQGRSKKLARIQAAEAALKSFIQFKDGTGLSPVKTVTNMDFTSDDHIENVEGNKSLINKKQVPEKGPVMLLYELFNDVQIDFFFFNIAFIITSEYKYV